MPVAKIDPVETFYSVGSSLVGRILLFFSAGWLGLLIGRVALAFHDWSDFLAPADVFDRVMVDFEGEVLIMVLWPFVVLFTTAVDNVGLFFVVLIVFAVAFLVIVLTEEPTPLWWLILVAVTSLVPVFVFDDSTNPGWPSAMVLLFFWGGFGALAWWLLRKYHPEVIEVVEKVVQGGLGESDPPSTPRRKAPPGTWPDGVEGFEDDDEDV